MVYLEEVVRIPLEPMRRPVIKFRGIAALIDTGATIPIFYFPVDVLEKAFNGIDTILDNAQISGIGKGKLDGKVYALHDFILGKLNYKNLNVFVPDHYLKTNEYGTIEFQEYPILFSATMFEGLDYEFDNTKRLFIVNAPTRLNRHMDFKIVKTTAGSLIPVVNGVFVQEEVTSYTQNRVDDFQSASDLEVEDEDEYQR